MSRLLEYRVGRIVSRNPSPSRLLRFEPLERREMLDGTPRLVKDIYPGSPASRPTELVAFGDVLLFAAEDGTTGLELWRSDGTEAGTYRVKDIWPGPAGSDPRLKSGFRSGDLLVFTAYDGVHGPKLWRTDGTETGTFLVPEGTELPPVQVADTCESSISAYGVCYFFVGGQPWIDDGSGARPLNLPVGFAGDFAVLRSLLLFTANDGVSGEEFWRTDGTAAGTALVKDTNPGPGRWSSSLGSESWVVINCSLFFANRERATGHELWISNGTEEGTHRVRDIWPGLDDGFGSGALLANVNGTMYFSANDFTHGWELWKTDGTESGTQMVADIWPGAGPRNPPLSLTSVNDKLFFVTNDGITGEELWVLDVPMIGDFDEDADVDHADIDLMADAIRTGVEDAAFDLTSDGRVDQADYDYLILHVLGTRPGDANLDCSVDERDVVAASPSLGAMDGRGWSDGDFNGDGRVDLVDLSTLQSQLDVRMPDPPSGPSPAAAPAAELQAREVHTDRIAEPHNSRGRISQLRASRGRSSELRAAAVDCVLTSGLETTVGGNPRFTLRASRGRRLNTAN